MDAFKLLTRSTKLKPAAAQNTAILPSTGKAANPQLFRTSAVEASTDGKGKGSGKKRKRAHRDDEAEDETRSVNEDALNLDFFSQKGSAPRASNAASRKGAGDGAAGDREDGSDSEEDEPMDEVQRRTVLNTHKIKVTDMRDIEEASTIQAPTPSEEPKKKKKRKQEEKEKEKQQTLSKKEQKKARRLYPQPLVSFKELRSKYKISRRLAENIAEQGFTVPTEVQLGSLPLLLGDGAVSAKSESKDDVEPDLLVVAPTGSGKTLSFMIPVINKIVRHHHEQLEERGIFAVVVAPTKELASQIVNEGRKLAFGTGVKITLMKKGMRVVGRDGDEEGVLNESNSESSDSESDEKPAGNKSKGAVPITKSDILVSTPLLLVNALSENKTKPPGALPLVRNLIMDEADVLLDPLFRDQTLDIWRSCTHPELRASLWSATMGSSIEDMAKETIKERKLNIAQTKSYPLIRLVVGLKDSAIPNIKHKLVYAATEQGKLLGLRQLLHPTAATASDVRLRPPFLVFTQTIPRAIALHSELLYDIPPEAGGSARIAVLHSDLSDTQRSEIMKGFRKGEIWILVTTDLLARGVDFRGINGVVNYDIPNSPAVYVHRVGRTGRAGREGGVAVTYYTKEDIPYVKSIANIIDTSEKLRGESGERSVQKWLLDALPDLSKKNKKELKKHGVKARQTSHKAADAKDDKTQRRTRISTKSGFERRQENRKKGAIAASRKRSQARDGTESDGAGGASDDEGWNGLDD